MSDDIYYNVSSEPIFIKQKIIPDKLGGPADFERKIIIMPGQGIDISILGLAKKHPYNQYQQLLPMQGKG